MLFHQRFEYDGPTNGRNIYISINKTSTLWTTFESRNPSRISSTFPSRIIDSEESGFGAGSQNTVIFTGIDPMMIEKNLGAEYRIIWKIEPDLENPSDKKSVLPILRKINFRFCHSNVNSLFYAMEETEIVLDYDKEKNVLYTSWFMLPGIVSWRITEPTSFIPYLTQKTRLMITSGTQNLMSGFDLSYFNPLNCFRLK